MDRNQSDSNTPKQRIRVLIADDSAVARQVLTEILISDPGIEVVGTAFNGQEAVTQAQRLKPDLIAMDLKMPVMDGMEATKKIMAHQPTPILFISAYVGRDQRHSVRDVLSVGALDVIEKPSVLPDPAWDSMARSLIEKVKMLSSVRVVTHVQGKFDDRSLRREVTTVPEKRIAVIGIGISTGGPGVLKELFEALPADFSLSILVVQHIAAGFTDGLVEWLSQVCPVPIKVAGEGETIRDGTIYFAREGAHLKVLHGRKMRYAFTQPRNGHRPSADILFNSLARIYKTRALGVLLTGMGCDGSDGLRAIHESGGETWVQDKKSCPVFGMPRAAIERNVAQRILSIPDIAAGFLDLHRASLSARSSAKQ